MSYRVYLLDQSQRIRAAEAFTAPDDREARAIAAALYASCCDVFPGYELWAGPRRIASGQSDGSMLMSEAVIQRHQGIILDLIDKLQREFVCVNRSQKLLEASAQLRQRQRFPGTSCS